MLSAAPAVLATASLAVGSLSLGMSVKNAQDIININGRPNIIGPTTSTTQAVTRFGNDVGTSLLNSTLLLNDEGLLFQGSNQIDFSNANQFVFSANAFEWKTSTSNIILNPDTINLVATNVLANGSPILTSADFSEFVKGPASATDTALARFNSTTGKLIENSTLLLSDNAILSANFNVIDLSNVDTINLIATHVQANGSDVLTSGDFSQFVQGPASATDTALARFNSTTGKLIENSIVLLSASGILSANSNQIDLSVTNTINFIATNVEANGSLIATASTLTTYVQGPASATDTALARFNSTTGKLIENSIVLLSASGILSANSNQIDLSTPNTLNLIATSVEANGSAIATASTLSTYVQGPASATDTALARFNSTTGKLIENSIVLLSASGILSANSNQIDLSVTNTINFIATNVEANGSAIATASTLSTYVQGPASATDTAVARFNSTTGKLIENSILLLSTSGILSANSNQIDLSTPNTLNLIATNVEANGSLIATASTLTTYVQGPASATDTAIARYNSTTGKLIEDSTLLLSNSAVLSANSNQIDLSVINTINFIATNVQHNGTNIGTVTNIATGTGLTGGPITTTGTISIATTGVTATSYTNANITVNAQGQITTASNGTSGTVTNIATGTGLTGGPITSTGTISIANTTVTPASYTLTNLTVNAQGQITSASNGTAVTNIATGTGLTGGPITTTGTISIATTGVTATSYTNANITVNAQGQITTASNGTSGTVTNIATGTGLTGGPITSTGTISIANTTVTPASYTLTNLTVNAQGQITSASNGTAVTNIATGTGLTGGPITTTGTISIATTGVTAASYTNANITVNAQGQITTASNGPGGTVTSVAATTSSTGLTITGSPITTSGTLTFTLATALQDTFGGGTFNLSVGKPAAVFGSGSDITAIGDSVLQHNTSGTHLTAVGYQSLLANTTGSNNTAIGVNSLVANTTGSGNVCVGESSLSANTIGNDNSVFGYQAAMNYTNDGICAFGFQAALLSTSIAGLLGSGGITAIGFQSLVNNTTGYGNTGVGVGPLNSNTTGIQNVGVGDFAIYYNDVGNNNTAVGFETCGGAAVASATTMNDNTACGATALGQTLSGNRNSAFGSGALAINTSDHDLCAFGYQALNVMNTTDAFCSAFGSGAAQLATTATNLDAFGYQALAFCTTGTYNCAIGNNSQWSNNTGDNNVSVGALSLYQNRFGSGNSVLGVQAGGGSAGAPTSISGTCAFGYRSLASSGASGADHNCAFGYQSLTSSAAGKNNSVFGYQSGLNYHTDGLCAFGYQTFLQLNTGGDAQSSAFGYQAANATTSGTNIDAFGYQSLLANTTGSNNCAIGTKSQLHTTTGSHNVSVGGFSLGLNVTGNENSIFGFEAALNYTTDTICAFGYQAAKASTSIADPPSTGSITAMGYQSLLANTTGWGNIGIGFQAVFSNTSGTTNVGIGDFTIPWNDTGTNNTAVGYAACGGFQAGPAATMSNNSAFGAGALGSGTTGNQNCAFGALALEAISSQSNNCAFGYSAGAAITSGTTNCFFGAQSGNGVITNLTNCSLFGANTSTSSTVTNAGAFGANAIVAVDNAIVLGDSTIPTKVGIGRNDPQNILHTVGTVQLQGISSGYTGSGLLKSQNGLSTTAAGTTTLDFLLSTTTPNVINVKSRIAVMNTAGLKAGYAETIASAFWNGTTTASVGTLPTITFTTTAAYAVAAAWSISGNNLRLTVTGDAGGNDRWVVSSERFLTTNTNA